MTTHSDAIRVLAKSPPNTDLVRWVAAGVSYGFFRELAGLLGTTEHRLAGLTGISASALSRCKKIGRFSEKQSDHIIRFARLWWISLEVFENELCARKWLNTRQLGLAGAVPLDYAKTETGARAVEDLLARIDHHVLA